MGRQELRRRRDLQHFKGEGESALTFLRFSFGYARGGDLPGHSSRNVTHNADNRAFSQLLRTVVVGRQELEQARDLFDHGDRF